MKFEQLAEVFEEFKLNVKRNVEMGDDTLRVCMICDSSQGMTILYNKDLAGSEARLSRIGLIEGAKYIILTDTYPAATQANANEEVLNLGDLLTYLAQQPAPDGEDGPQSDVAAAAGGLTQTPLE